VNGDALKLPLTMAADRAVVPAPYGMDNALELLAPLVKKGGVLHFYTFKKKHQIDGLIDEYKTMGLEVELCRRCGNVAPAVSRWAFDLIKK
jgi:tRNA (guanine37-N1)-methyltransferase